MARNEESPKNGRNARGFQVRTPICHIVPVSRAYPYPSPRPPQRAQNEKKIRTKSVEDPAISFADFRQCWVSAFLWFGLPGRPLASTAPCMCPVSRRFGRSPATRRVGQPTCVSPTGKNPLQLRAAHLASRIRRLLHWPQPQHWIKFWTYGSKNFIQYWAAVWHPHRESTVPPNTGTG